MNAPRFTVPVKDLDYGDRELDEEIPVEWLAAALEGSEATPSGRPGHLTATLTKTGRQILVRGRARAEVTMPCARTLDPVFVPLQTDLLLLLEPRHEQQKPAQTRGARMGAKATKEAKATAGGRRDPARAHGAADAAGRPGRRGSAPRQSAAAEDPLLSDEDAAQDTYDGERVVLDGFIREFLLLELPLFPLREDLRSEATPAIDVPPQSAPASEGRPEGAIDPRLAPLAAIASRLKQAAKKE